MHFAILLLFALLLFALVVVKDMSDRGIWCARTKVQIEAQCRALVAVAEALNKVNATHWLCYGSALAATRGKQYGASGGGSVLQPSSAWPIPWESDDDLCVFEEDSVLIEAALAAVGEGPLRLKTEVLIGNVVRYRITRSDGAAGDEWKVDVYSHVRRSFFGNLEMVQNTAPNRDRAHRDFPAALLEPLQMRQRFCGSNAFALPRDDIAYVMHVFGSTWKTPIASFTGSNGYRRLSCLLSSLSTALFDSVFGGGDTAQIGPSLRLMPQLRSTRKVDT